jgi:hypothetical protein
MDTEQWAHGGAKSLSDTLRAAAPLAVPSQWGA